MKKSKLTVFIIALITFSIFLLGCTSYVEEDSQNKLDNQVKNEKYPIEVVDDIGNSITINKKPERVVSIGPGQTEILFYIGVEDRLVGVSNYCNYPAEALQKEKVGDALTINVEKILELSPDIVFLYSDSSQEAIDQIKASGIQVVVFEPETIDEVFTTILQTGQIMGVEEKANEIIRQMEEKKNSIVNKVKDKESVRVFYQIWDEPLMTAGQGSFINELITLAGGENIASDVEDAYPQYSVESMIEKDPEIFIAPAHTAENFDLSLDEMEELKNSIKSRPGYDVITAIKNDRIELLDPDIVSRPGVRIIECLELFAKAIHPEIF